MKRKISLVLALAIAVTALVLPVNAFASSHTVNVKGMDRLTLTNVAEVYESSEVEDADSLCEFTCSTSAVLTIFDDMADILVEHMIHDPENGSSSGYLVPDGYSYELLNEYGQFMDLPANALYTLDERGMYYYDIQFEDGTVAVGYIYVDENAVPMEEDMVTPEIPAEPELPAVEVPEMPECGFVTVVSKSQALQIEEWPAYVNAYNIFDNNYIKLRDFAYYYSALCSNTDKWFDVTWDGEKNAINLIRGQEYTSDGTEGGINTGVYADAVLSDSKVYLDGEYIPLTAFNINGNNYFKLRDLCQALDISISWWGVQEIIYINSDYGYGMEFEEIVPDAM